MQSSQKYSEVNSLNVTLKDPNSLTKKNDSPPLKVTPNEVIFKDIEVNKTYIFPLMVRNLTKKSRRIRVYQPNTSKFKVDYDIQDAIASGLSIKMLVAFSTDNLEESHDVIRIVSDGGLAVEVQMHAYPPQADIKFDPRIDWGFVRVGKEEIKVISFKNVGTNSGRVELKAEKMPEMKIEPPNFVLAPQTEQEVIVHFRARETGNIRGTIDVMAEGSRYSKTIDICGTGIEYNCLFIDANGTQVAQFDFSTNEDNEASQLDMMLNTPKQKKITLLKK